MVATFTQLGLPITTLRFLPSTKRRSRLLSAATICIVVASILGGIAGLATIGLLAPKLGFVHHSALLIVMLVMVILGTSLAALTDGVMTSLKKSEYVFSKAILMNIPRVVLPFTIASLGTQGVVGVYAAVTMIGAIYGLSVIKKKWLKSGSMRPDFSELLRHRKFAAANYFGSMFGILPGTLTPLIVLDKLGATQAAFFYMPMQMAVFLGVICSSSCQALLAETAQNDDSAQHVAHAIRATKHLYRMLTPAALLMGVMGWGILRIYGPSYAHQGYLPLIILCAASLLVAANWIGDTWLNIKQRPMAYFLMNACNAIAVVGSVYVLAGHGLVGVATGWLIGQVISAAIYVVLFARDQLLALRLKVLRYTA